MRRILSIILSLTLVFSLIHISPAAEDTSKTPADFGWSNDGNDFTGWNTDSDGTITAANSETNGNRIWHSLGDKDNFALSVTVQPTVHRVYIRMFGQNICVNIEGGNGNQAYCEIPDDSVANDWINAKSGIVTLTAERRDGGTVSAKLSGQNGGTKTFTISPSEENENVEFGFWDDDDAVVISEFKVDALGEESDTNTPENATEIIFSGSGDWVPANISPDNTKSYKLGLDLSFAKIKGVTATDTWADDFWLVIRNETADSYLKVQLQTYCNGSGKYQVFMRVQEWTGSSWVTYAENWSDTSDIPIEKIRAVFSYNKKGVFSWRFIDLENNNIIGSGSTEGEEILETITSCSAAELKYYHNDSAITVENAYIVYDEAGEEPTVEIPEGAKKISFSGSGDWVPANISPDNTKSYELAYDMEFSIIKDVDSPDTWADDTRLVIRNAAVDPYINVQVQTYCNGSGKYQIFVRVQEWTGSSWVTYAESWSDAMDDPIQAIHAVYQYNKAGVFSWDIQDKKEGKTLIKGTTEGQGIDESITDCTSCELKYYRNNTSITVENAYILYEAEEPVTYDHTPDEFGWSSDGNDFTGWLAAEDGTIKAAREDVNVHRIWHSLGDSENFNLSITVQPTVHRVYLRMLGQNICVNIAGGNGNQAYCEVPDGDVADDWLNASGGIVTLKAERLLGGYVNCTLQGKGGATRSFVLKPAEENENIEVGFWDEDDAVIISDFSVTLPNTYSPADFGWQNDENDFTGWVADSNGTITSARSEVNINRIWHALGDDKENFKLSVTIQPTSHRVYVRMFGQNLCINVSGGDGNQAYLELPDESVENDWIYARSGIVTLLAVRKGGGNIDCTVTGKAGAAVSFTIKPSEENENVEVGFWDDDDAVVISDFSVTDPEETDIEDNMKKTAFTKVVFSGDLTGDWKTLLIDDFTRYQNVTPVNKTVGYSADEIISEKGDLVILGNGKEDILTGKAVSEYRDTLETILSKIDSGSTVVVIAGLPYLKDADPTLMAAYNAAAYALARKYGALYADLYNAFSAADHMREEDGSTFSPIGNTLVEGEILHQLMRACPCLAVNATVEPSLTKVEVTLDESLVSDFKKAGTADLLKAVVENERLGLNLATYRNLEVKSQSKVIETLLGLDRSSVSSLEDADRLLQTAIYTIGYDRTKVSKTSFPKWVAVGDSITVGETAVNKATDAWVPILKGLIENAQGESLTLVNKAISGTRMCTRTDNDQFPPASETVQEYIVSNSPDLLTIAYGVNDLNAGTELTTFISTYRAYLNEVIESCSDTTIVVCGIGPMGNDGRGEQVRAWNAAIKSLVEELELIYVETYYDTYYINWLLTDGLHPTNAGYRVISNAIFRGISAYIAFGDEPADDPTETKTPGDFGWENDTNDFTGWTATDEANFSVNLSKAVHNRVWKALIEDTDNSELTMTIQPGTESSAYLKIFEHTIELDARHGNGNQVYYKIDGNGKDWIDAAGREMTVKAVCTNGGDITVTLTGKDNVTPVTFTFNAVEEKAEVEVGCYDGTAAFREISWKKAQGSGDEPIDNPDDPTETKTPGDFGWENDTNDFTGWTATDEANFAVDNSKAAHNRVWKALIEDTKNSELSLVIQPGVESSGYLKIFEYTIELDARHGNGNQVYYKLDGRGKDWVDATEREMTVKAVRTNGGNITVTLTGKDNGTPVTFTFSAAEEKAEVEVGTYAGTVDFKKISWKKTESTDPGEEPGEEPGDEPGDKTDTPVTAKTPGDFGWENDTNNFTGWTATDEANFSVNLDQAKHERVWKALLTNKNTFELTMTIQPGVESSGYLKIFERTVELDARHGDGNQTYVKQNGIGKDWVTAADREMTLKVTRTDGGKITVTITGKGNSTPMELTFSAAEEKAEVELGCYAGTVDFKNIVYKTDSTSDNTGGNTGDNQGDNSGETTGTKTPGDFGWENDSNNFTGWTATDEFNFKADASEIVYQRVWKPLLTDKQNFTLTFTMKPVGTESSGYLKIFEHAVELDARHGNGNQAYLKLDGKGYDWISGTANVMHVTVTRENGGKIKVTIKGEGGNSSGYLEFDSLEEKAEVELGLYAGNVEFSNIKYSTQVQQQEEREKTLYDFGWRNDTNDFTGWVAKDGANFSAELAKTVNKRVWKSLYPAKDDFKVVTDVTVGSASEAYVRLFGMEIQLDTRHSEGDQVNVKLSGSDIGWLKTSGYKVHVEVSRKGNGSIKATVTGIDGEALSFDITPAEDNENYELGLHAGSAKYNNIASGKADADTSELQPSGGEAEPSDNPDDPSNNGKEDEPTLPAVESYGWHNYSDDFTGWEFESGSHFGGDAADLSVNRANKELIEDPESFALQTVLHLEDGASASVTVLGQTFTVTRNGDAITIQGPDGTKQTLTSNDGAVNLTASRTNGGKLTAAFSTADADSPAVFTADAKENTKEVELAINKGKVLFTSVGAAASVDKLGALEKGDPAAKSIPAENNGGSETDPAADENGKKPNVALIAGASLGGILLIGGAIYLIAAGKKKKKEDEEG